MEPDTPNSDCSEVSPAGSALGSSAGSSTGLSTTDCSDSDVVIISFKTLDSVISLFGLKFPIFPFLFAKFFRNCSKIFTAAVFTSFDKVPCLIFSLISFATSINWFVVTSFVFFNKSAIWVPPSIVPSDNPNVFKAVSKSFPGLLGSVFGKALTASFALPNQPLL